MFYYLGKDTESSFPSFFRDRIGACTYLLLIHHQENSPEDNIRGQRYIEANRYVQIQTCGKNTAMARNPEISARIAGLHSGNEIP